MRAAAPIAQIRYSRYRGAARTLASRSSHQAASPLRTAHPAMTRRKAVRCSITKADRLTARMPTGVMTPSVSSTTSRRRRERWLVAAAAGLGAAGVVAGVERVPARARVHRVRVVDREAGPHEAVHVVDLAAADVGRAEVVDHDLNAVLVDGDVLGPAHIVEGHAVLHARAAAAADEDAEGQLGVPFLGEQLLEACLGVGGE